VENRKPVWQKLGREEGERGGGGETRARLISRWRHVLESGAGGVECDELGMNFSTPGKKRTELLNCFNTELLNCFLYAASSSEIIPIRSQLIDVKKTVESNIYH
jgi:hypothetical protein